jgi:peptidoglycan/xylan/chitin deacetylase (PgdA/CDA1 family)
MEKTDDPEQRVNRYRTGLAFFTCILFMFGCNSKSKHTPPPAEKPPEVKYTQKDSFDIKPENGKKKLYLTFDDGPNTGTRVVMNILKEAKVPATFFMIGLHRKCGTFL